MVSFACINSFPNSQWLHSAAGRCPRRGMGVEEDTMYAWESDWMVGFLCVRVGGVVEVVASAGTKQTAATESAAQDANLLKGD